MEETRASSMSNEKLLNVRTIPSTNGTHKHMDISYVHVHVHVSAVFCYPVV